MVSSILGARIRQRRREIGITQADLARKVGISASYLNLIEWNKRRIAGALLRRIAVSLELPLEDLAGVSEERLLETLREIASSPALADVGIEATRTNELIGRFPGWAKGVAALARSEREAVARTQVLSDRLSNDPFLSETVHRMLTRIAAIRSAAEILSEYAEVPAARRERFTHIIHEESRTLSEVGEALAAYLDHAQDTDRALTPVDEVEALFDAHGHHFEEIEAAAVALVPLLEPGHPARRRAQARELAEARLMARIDDLIGRQPQVKTAAAFNRARRVLTDYAAGAALMPLEAFAETAVAVRYDIEALCEAFAVEFQSVCHRLTALPLREGVPRFGYFRANAAGTIIEKLHLEGLSVPRYAPACPLWVLYRAQATPEQIVPSGARFVFVARATRAGAGGFGQPRHYVTDMLAVAEDEARLTVYRPEPSVLVEDVGPSCRVCRRRNCVHRVEDPLSE